MRIKSVLIVTVLLFLLTTCRGDKGTKEAVSDEQIVENYENEIDGNTSINFQELETLIKESEKLDVNVFFAISVLHKYYVDLYTGEAADLSEEEQKAFFENKKKDFFSKIKYSQQEYEDFMINNQETLNSYINLHPEVIDYLTTIN